MRAAFTRPVFFFLETHLTTENDGAASNGNMGLAVRLFSILLLTATACAGTPGIFRGVLYPGRDTKPGWVYIVGRNDTLRLVHIAKANIVYAEEFPAELRNVNPAKALKPGADVRVTAEQDAKGNWRASEVEIISPKEKPRRRRNPKAESSQHPELQTRKN